MKQEQFTPGHKSVENRKLKSFELDKYSILIVFSNVSIIELKRIVQKHRENIDWYGFRYNDMMIFNCAMEIIKIIEPSFQTEFVAIS